MWVAAALAASGLLYHALSWTRGLVASQDDVETFFFPLLAVTAEALRNGHVLLWTPGMFGGYPLFADGESGMLYPLNLLLLPLLPAEASYVALLVIHAVLAAFLTYYLLRTLGCGRLPALVGALVYAYSGFAAGQVVHANVIRAMVWLPLELALAERMCSARGRERLAISGVLAGVFGVQGLAAHIHITLLSALTVSAFIAYRWIGASAEYLRAGRPALLGAVRRSLVEGGSLLGCLALLGGLGAGLAAVQLLPLWELGTQTYRGAGLDVTLSTPNSVWAGGLATLVLPHLHDVDARDYWGPWVKWETVLYVGVLPLLLAPIGLLFGDGRHRLFFVALGIGSLLCAFGSFGPLPLWDALHHLPGFNVLKSPGRFSLLFSLAVAVGAAYGVEWLARRVASARRAALVAAGGCLVVAVLGIGLGLASARFDTWTRTGSILVEEYLRLPGVPRVVEGERLTYDRLARYAADALAPSNPRTAGQLALLAAAGLAMASWFLGPRMRSMAASLTVAVTFVDLWIIGATFHPLVPLEELRSRAPSFLAPGEPETFRVFTMPSTGDKVSQADPNRMLPLGVQEATGYSSLPPDRHASYLARLLETDDDLLDLWNVRYIVRSRRGGLQPDWEGVSFHPTRPLIRGKLGDRERAVHLLPEGGPARAQELRVVAALVNSTALTDGEPVARLELDTPSETLTLTLLAGEHVSDATAGAPGVSGVAHRQADVAFDHQRTNPNGERYGHQIYGSTLLLETPATVVATRVIPSPRVGALHVFGLGLYDAGSREVTQLWDRPDRPVVYIDDEVIVSQNHTAVPRAFLLPAVRVLPAGHDALLAMHDGPFDPRRFGLLEGPVPPAVVVPRAVSEPAEPVLVPAELVSYASERIVLRTDARRPSILMLQDPFFPGWVARIDGQRAPILRGNYLFRAVSVPAGQHEITFTYEPITVGIGLLLSLISASVIVVLVALGLLVASPRRDGVP